MCSVVSFPDPTMHARNGLGTLKHFLGLAHHHVTSRAPIQTYAYYNHMIAELAQPRISANVPRPFLCMLGGVWDETMCSAKHMENIIMVQI